MNMQNDLLPLTSGDLYGTGENVIGIGTINNGVFILIDYNAAKSAGYDPSKLTDEISKIKP